MHGLKKRLLNLAVGEFVALCIFIYIYRQLSSGTASFIAFSYLIFILLQGSMYWFYRYILIIKKENCNAKVIKILGFLKWLNIVLLVTIGIAMLVYNSNAKDLIIATGLFIFGIIEYINYYWYRLSYGKSGFNIKILFNTGLKKSSINKIIQKYN